jgi:ParB/RepB/Spo0J family partition protein
MKTDLLALDRLTVSVAREASHTREDETLKASIAKTGIQQPLVVLSVGDELRLVDGWRRLTIARELGLPKVPVVIHEVPKDREPEEYAGTLRFILDEHRQDLLPSQRAELLMKIKSMTGFGNPEMATFLGVNKESIRNWLDILHYDEAVVKLLDSATIALNTARVFVGMTHEGQRHILKKHRDELLAAGKKEQFAKKMRGLYPPDKYPAFYVDPKVTQKNLQIASSMRKKAKAAPAYDAAEKRRLLASVELKESELADNRLEIKETKEECILFAPVVNGILRHKTLRDMVPDTMIEELEIFQKAGYG